MARMKLILTQEVGGLGAAGDVVDVAAGYGRNYLMPRGFAITWTRGGEKQIDLIKRARAAREIRTMEDAQAVAGRLQKLTVRVKRQGRLERPPVRLGRRLRHRVRAEGCGRPGYRQAHDRGPRPDQGRGRVPRPGAPPPRGDRLGQRRGLRRLIHSPRLCFPQPFPQGPVLHRKRRCIHSCANRVACPQSGVTPPGSAVYPCLRRASSGSRSLTICQRPATRAASSGSLASPRTSLASWSIAAVRRSTASPEFEHTDES